MPRLMLFFVLIVLGLNILGYAFPNAFTWGFHFFGFLPLWLSIAAVIFLLITAIILNSKDLTHYIQRLAGFSDKHPVFFLTTTIVFFLTVAITLRVQVPLLGDGFFLVKNFSDAFSNIAPLYFRDEPLATGFFWVVFYFIGVPTTYQEFLNEFLATDCLLAITFIVLVYCILKNVIADSTARLLGFLLILALPCMMLFFGYVETYAVVLVAISGYLLVATRFLRTEKSFALTAITFLIMALTHYMTLLLLPTFLFLSYREYRSRGIKPVMKGYGIIAAILFVILVAINFDVSPYYSYVPQHHYLSFSQATDDANKLSQAYTLLSPFHLLDLGNLFFLIALPALLLLGFGAVTGRLRHAIRLKEVQFLAAAIIPVLAFLCILKFDLGAARDWDVFAPYAILGTLFAIVIVAAATDHATVHAWLMIIVLAFVHSISFWFVNADTDASLARYDVLLDTRTLSQNGFYAASLHLAQYHRQTGNDSLPLVIWKRFNQIFPDDLRGYGNLITSWTARGHANIEEMIHTYDDWLSRTPQDTALRMTFRNFCLNLGNAYFKNTELKDAARFYVKAIQIDPYYPNAHNNLGSVYAQEGNIDQAVVQFQQAISLNPLYGEALYNLGNAYSDKGDAKLAQSFYQKAAQLNVEAAKELLKKPEKSP